DVEFLRRSNESRAFYKKNSQNDFKSKVTFCRDSHGEILSDPSGISKRWIEYLGICFILTLPTCSIHETQQSPMNLHEIPLTLEEVKLALRTLKLNNAVGPDRIPAEFVKFGGSLTTDCTHVTALAIDNEELLSNWTHGILCPIHKNGDPTYC
ncbi:hypothetical protein TNIN_21101, partial [Trichonephila inaurata madagascariensis]